jgi:hypothetical protein
MLRQDSMAIMEDLQPHQIGCRRSKPTEFTSEGYRARNVVWLAQRHIKHVSFPKL